MAVASFVLAGFLAMGPQWSLLDIPYPEVEAAPAASPEARIFETLCGYARSRASTLSRDDVALRIDGGHAIARLTLANRVETVHLQLQGGHWRVMRVE